MRKALIISMLFTLVMKNAPAQDPHFTQFTRIPAFYNPAATGYNVEHIRATMLYRNQWASVTSPFRTQALFFDKQVSRVGLGLNIVNNTAGAAGIHQLHVNGSLSYRQSFGVQNIIGGIQVGLIQKSFDPSAMTFDDQYSADQGFSASAPTAESFSYTKMTRPDAGAGLMWSMGTATSKYAPYAGISILHFNQPKESFIEQDNIHPVKYSAQAGFGVRLNDHLIVTPCVLYNQQHSAKEMMYGMLFKIPVEDRSHVEAGIYSRQHDAIALYTGYRYNSFMAGFSYDLNTSGLTNGPGAFELTLTYIPKAREKAKKPTVSAATTVRKPVHTPPKATVKKTEPPVASKEPVKKPEPVVVKNTEVKPQLVITKQPEKKEEPLVVKKEPVKETPPVNKTIVKPVIDKKPEAGKQPVKNEPVAVNKTIDKAEPVVKKTIVKPEPVVAKEPVKKAEPVVQKTIVKPEPVAVKKSVKKSEHVAVKTPAVKTEPVVVKVPVTKAEPKSVKAIEIKQETLAVKNVVPSSVSSIKSTEPIVINESVIKAEPMAVNPEPVKTEEPEISEPRKIQASVSAQPVALSNADSDNDGVPDKVDACPYLKGSVLTGGCPDTDGDGINDPDDKCPLLYGTRADKGCPANEKAAAITADTTIGNIEFITNSDLVKGIYKLDYIEPALDSLFAHPQYRLVITGHTDDEGSEQANMELSQKRADAVKHIFMRKGLDESRITTIAYGESMPLRDNNDETGRAKNRRAEIHLLNTAKP